MAGIYKMSKDEFLKGVSGKENEPRKVAKYLARRCCAQTLLETAKLFGLESYGAVGWGCDRIKSKIPNDRKCKSHIESLEAGICQQKI